MMRIYYNPTTGDLLQKINIENAFDNSRPYVDVDEDIKLNQWRFDLVAKKLIPNDLTNNQLPPHMYEQYLD